MGGVNGRAAALLFGLALPVSAVQILWINMVTGITLGLVLAFDPSDPATMRRPPRDPSESLLSRGLLWQTLFVSVLFLVAAFAVYSVAVGRGDDLATAQTLVMNTLVALEIANLFAIRATAQGIGQGAKIIAAFRATWLVWASVLGVIAAQVLMTTLPPLQSLFGTQALATADLGLIGAVAGAFFVIVLIEDRVRRFLQK